MSDSSNVQQRRMMLITNDEKIIEQIRSNNNPSSFETFILEYEENSKRWSLDDGQTKIYKKSKRGSYTCVICGSTALGRNFGVIACESCKIFFRRNALRDPATLHCRHNNTCEITCKTRRYCSSCRLAKCFVCGMKRDKLLKTEQKISKRVLKQDHLCLSLQLNDEVDTQPFPVTVSKQVTTIDSSSYAAIFDEYLPQSSCELNRVILSPEDLQRLDNIQCAFEKRIELAASHDISWNSAMHATTLLQHLNSYSMPAMRLLSFFKQIPEFNHLNIEDKLFLAKHNIMTIFIFYGTFLFNIQTKQIQETDTDEPMNLSILRAIHGPDLFRHIKKIFLSFVQIKFYDYKIIQMLLIIFLLSDGLSTGEGESESMLANSLSVYHAQNCYTELLWKYLEATYGLEQACGIFNIIVTHFLTWQKLEKQVRFNIKCKLSTIDEKELLPLIKSLLHIS